MPSQPVVYAYSGCGTCRNALKWLASKGIQPKVVAIRETPPSIAELKQALAMGIPLKGLFNTSGGDYKSLDMKSKLPGLSEAQALSILHGNGNLVKRPFVVHGGTVIVGFKPEQWEQAFGD
ncbi:MAG TPA: ArsC/Spx/MgsR family protein [Fibrobacteria bacterium]|nr:ArsC/Spx/MgsR family protein [Fibrobacteria bacterium]